MKIAFNYKGVSYEHSLMNEIFKIYSVPVAYSEDGLYFADYSKHTTEPAPASISLETELLYHGVLKRIMGEEYMEEIENKLGEVIYAKD